MGKEIFRPYMELDFYVQGNNVYLKVTHQNQNIYWLTQILDSKDDTVTIKSFKFKKTDIVNCKDSENNCVIFKIGAIIDDYIIFSKRILDTSAKVFFDKSIKLRKELFFYSMGSDSINYFKEISQMLPNKNEFYIGGSKADISIDAFELLIKKFPNQHEQTLYVKSRIFHILENYFEIPINHQSNYDEYMNNKYEVVREPKSFTQINRYEIDKFKLVLEKLNFMMNNMEKYSEKLWQIEIAKIILLLFPKYIAYVDEIKINIPQGKSTKTSERFDFLLITSSGNVDILEIKKPNTSSIISSTTDRDNYYPTNFLSKTIMQTEKYLYHLNMLGYDAGQILMKSKKVKNKISSKIILEVINPKGLVILGNEKDFTKQQIYDLEVIKKMYANVLEIITYDDLIKRLNNTINALRKENNIT